MKDPEVISRTEAELMVAASPSAFTAFEQRHGLRPLIIAQGTVYRRSEFYAAVARALKEAERDAPSAGEEAA